MSRGESPITRRWWLPPLVALVAIAAGQLLSVAVPSYFVFVSTSVLIATISLIGLGVVTGTAGMIALCQLTFAAAGAFVVSWANLVEAPGGFVVWIMVGGILASLVGVVIGLPALRLRGVSLAVLTLGFAAAAEATLTKIQFPGSLESVRVVPPQWIRGDRPYFVFVLVVTVLLALAVWYLQRSRWGSAWKSVAFSERGTASAGTDVRFAKLTAFATSAFIAGVSGGLLTGQVGQAFASSFSTVQSLGLYVLSVVAGSHLLDMALLGGILFVLVPELLKRWGIPQDWANIVFGVLGVQALASASNLGQHVRDVLARRRRRPVEAVQAAAAAPSSIPVGTGETVLSVRGLSVAFGPVKALSDVHLDVEEGTIVGLIGPNGAGKSTFVDALTGFLPQHEGTVQLDGVDLGQTSPNKRARAGLRRTFQQDRVPTTLTVGAYIRFVAGGTADARMIDDVIDHFGCPPADTPLATVDVGNRRLVEVAANVAARPRVLLLDEPAAGLSHAEHLAFGDRLRQVPTTFGITILIIEHDLDLVRSTCTSLVVLDFGTVLAVGSQADVLSNPEVLAAYMGETELL